MTKEEYVAEILSDELTQYGILVEVTRKCAEIVVQGLDMWGEISGESVASSNRYGYLEREKEDSIKRVKKEMEAEEQKHKEEKQEIERNVRWMKARYQETIDDLRKQIK